MPTPKKEAIVESLAAKLGESVGCVVTDYRGLDVATITELRRKLADCGIEYRVVKNTLVKLAAKRLGLPDMDELFAGPTAIAFIRTEPVVCAKLISEFSRLHRELEIKGGLLQGSVLNADGVRQLATLPSREVLLGQLLGAMQGPITGLVNVLAGTIRNLASVLDAIREKKEKAA